MLNYYSGSHKAKAGKPVCTKDGKPVRIICWDAKIPGKSIVGLALDPKTGLESIYVYNNAGACGGCGSSNDLMMTPQKVTKYVNLYKCFNNRRRAGCVLFPSVIKAKEAGMKHNDYICTTKLEWEE